MHDMFYENNTVGNRNWEITKPPSTFYARWSLSKKSFEREYQWAFIGGLHGNGKNDREAMLS